MLPTDPMILLSYVNTQLRDFYPDLTSFCKDNGLDQEEICKSYVRLITNMIWSLISLCNI